MSENHIDWQQLDQFAAALHDGKESGAPIVPPRMAGLSEADAISAGPRVPADSRVEISALLNDAEYANQWSEDEAEATRLLIKVLRILTEQTGR